MKLFIVAAAVCFGLVASNPTLPVRTTAGRGRIVGGVDVEIEDFPYQLSLRRRDSHSCGASVLNDHWALTAAHCTFPVPDLDIMSLQGGSSNHLEGGQIFEIDRIENHPRYNPMTISFDVSVVHTVEPLVGPNIAPIPLVPVDTYYPAGTRAVVAGWGVTSPGGSRPDILQAINIPLIDIAECAAAWPGFISDDMLCANEPGRDACNADSGGPLVTGGRQLGIVSWGSPNCDGTMPGVYARVAHPEIRGWIVEITGIN